MEKLAPHPVLDRYYKHEDARRETVDFMFDESAKYYDRVIGAMSFGSGGWYRRHVLKRSGIKPGSKVLDVDAGTGAVTLPAQKLAGENGLVIALDPSAGMLNRGRRLGVQIAVRGFGERLPFPDESFEFVTMGYALRHVADLTGAFKEYLRVLKPGGRVLLLEIVRPQSKIKHLLLKIHLRHIIPNLSAVLSGRTQVRRLMQYYWDTIDQCVAPSVVLQSLKNAGFTRTRRTLILEIFSEYLGRKPV